MCAVYSTQASQPPQFMDIAAHHQVAKQLNGTSWNSVEKTLNEERTQNASRADKIAR